MDRTSKHLPPAHQKEALNAFAKALNVHFSWTMAGLFRENVTPTPKFVIRKTS